MRGAVAAIALLAALAAAPAAKADFAAGARAYDGGDYATAFAEWMALAESGHVEAQVAIAGLYRHGAGRPADPARAAHWYEKAASGGDAIAQANLAEMYLKGVGLARDAVMAFVWFSRATANGNDWAAGQRARLAARLTDADRRRADAILRADP